MKRSLLLLIGALASALPLRAQIYSKGDLLGLHDEYRLGAGLDPCDSPPRRSDSDHVVTYVQAAVDPLWRDPGPSIDRWGAGYELRAHVSQDKRCTWSLTLSARGTTDPIQGARAELSVPFTFHDVGGLQIFTGAATTNPADAERALGSARRAWVGASYATFNLWHVLDFWPGAVKMSGRFDERVLLAAQPEWPIAMPSGSDQATRMHYLVHVPFSIGYFARSAAYRFERITNDSASIARTRHQVLLELPLASILPDGWHVDARAGWEYLAGQSRRSDAALIISTPAFRLGAQD